MMSLWVIHEQMEEDAGASLVWIYADHEPLTFQEAIEEENRVPYMQEEAMLFKRIIHGSWLPLK